MHIFPTLAIFASTVSSAIPTNAQFQDLYNVLKREYTDHSASIPEIVRASFHDLANANGVRGGPRGCLRNGNAKLFDGNLQLVDPVRDLFALVDRKFTCDNFSDGDVISLAGKVAIELAYPCIRINWRGGRPPCSTDPATSETNLLPSGKISDLAGLQPFLDRYNFTKREFAVLLAGGHGLGDGAIRSSTLSTFLPFALTNSVKDYIVQTFSLSNWFIFPISTFPISYLNNFGVWRLPVDMMFYPSVLKRMPGTVPDTSFAATETFLKLFVNLPEWAADDEFQRVFTKMLEIGIDTNLLGPVIQNRPLSDACIARKAV